MYISAEHVKPALYQGVQYESHLYYHTPLYQSAGRGHHLKFKTGQLTYLNLENECKASKG